MRCDVSPPLVFGCISYLRAIDATCGAFGVAFCGWCVAPPSNMLVAGCWWFMYVTHIVRLCFVYRERGLRNEFVACMLLQCYCFEFNCGASGRNGQHIIWAVNLMSRSINLVGYRICHAECLGLQIAVGNKYNRLSDFEHMKQVPKNVEWVLRTYHKWCSFYVLDSLIILCSKWAIHMYNILLWVLQILLEFLLRSS